MCAKRLRWLFVNSSQTDGKLGPLAILSFCGRLPVCNFNKATEKINKRSDYKENHTKRNIAFRGFLSHEGSATFF